MKLVGFEQETSSKHEAALATEPQCKLAVHEFYIFRHWDLQFIHIYIYIPSSKTWLMIYEKPRVGMQQINKTAKRKLKYNFTK